MRNSMLKLVLLGMLGSIAVAVGETEKAELLEKYRNIYDSTMAEHETIFRGESQACAVDYIKALQTLQNNSQAAGDLDGWEIADKELKRFREEPRIQEPKSDVPALRALQDAYVTRKAGVEKDRNQKVSALTEKYVARLTVLQREWTQAGAFEDAFRVRDEIGRVNAIESVIAARGQDSERETEASQDAPRTERPPVVVQTGDRQVLPDRSIRFAPGVLPVSDADIVYKSKRLSETENNPWPMLVSVKLMETSARERDTAELDRLFGDVKITRKSDERHVRVELRATKAGDIQRDLQLIVQYFAKPAGGYGDPRMAEEKRIDIPLLDTRLTYVDVAPVTVESISRELSGRPFRDTTATQGNKFYGYIVTLLSHDGQALYQGATTGVLGDMATVPILKRRQPRAQELAVEADPLEGEGEDREEELPNDEDAEDARQKRIKERRAAESRRARNPKPWIKRHMGN